MSTVYGARGMHIMAESRPPYSLGLFGHRSNPFLEAFEKATQLCRLINCKSWPSPNYCMKLHRKVSWSPGKPVALKTETNFKTPGQVCCQHISICCILKVWDAALSCTRPPLLFLDPTYVYFISLSLGDKKTMKLLTTFVFQLVMENIIRRHELWWNVELCTLGGPSPWLLNHFLLTPGTELGGKKK